MTETFLKTIKVYSRLLKILVHHRDDEYEMSFTIYPLCTVYHQETKQRKTIKRKNQIQKDKIQLNNVIYKNTQL